jgi:CubicO group peptidase (beta-lactamase class C family)
MGACRWAAAGVAALACAASVARAQQSDGARWSGGAAGAVEAAGAAGAVQAAGAVEAAGAVRDGVHGALAARMDAYLRRSAALGFSGQVLAARHGEVLLHRAYGFADRARRVPLTTTTRVGVASMSKQFAAAAVLRLESEGRLSLNDSLGSFFTGVPADKQAITLQQLLTHTAGIRAGMSDDFDMPSLGASMARLFTLPLTGPVGARWQYASDAYGIVAAIVQRASGMAYGDYLRSALFAPAAMSHTGLWTGTQGTTDSVARAYTGWRDRGSPREWPIDWRVFGSGDLLTTAADLYRWHLALEAGRVLSPAARAKYMSPQVAIGGDPRDSYGYGLFVTETKTHGRVIEHGGDTELGYNGSFLRYADSGAVLIITSNASDFYQRSLRRYVEGDLEAMLFGADTARVPPNVTPLAASRLVTLAGDYPVGNATLHLVSDGVYLWAAPEGESLVSRLRPMRPTDDPASFAGATDRTAALLAGLEAYDSAAYDVALGDSAVLLRKEYIDEWKALTATFGPLHGYQILGAVREGATVVVYARLGLRDGDEVMTFRWSQLGKGRLVGTRPRPAAKFPVVLPVAALGNGDCVVYDLWWQRERARIRPIDGGRLRIEVSGDSSHAGAVLVTAPVRRIGVPTP